jgi:hypothetical protein
MNIELINDIIELRHAVAYLGERKSWWNSKFYDTSSKDFLAYIFPKSKNTQYSCSIVSTRDFIDNQVGASYYHLFRLPMLVEELINKNGIDANSNIIESDDDALNVLARKASGLSIDGNSGPKNVGSVDLLNNDIIQVMAAEYFNAFKNDYKVHPYLN